MPQRHECPFSENHENHESNEKLALLLENKLSEAERDEVLLHIADCNECAMTYSVAGAMLKESVVQAKKAKRILFNPRWLSHAAAVVLLVSAGIYGGIFYARRDFVPISAPVPVTSGEYPTQTEDRVALSALPTPQIQPSVMMAEQEARPEPDILARSAPSAPSARRNRQAQFNETLLPSEAWERYPKSEEFLKTLAWIAGLPEERKKEILALTPEEAIEEMRKEEALKIDK